MTMILRDWKRRLLVACGASAAMLVSLAAAANPFPWQVNMPYGATEVAHKVWDLHMAAFWVSVGMGVIVFGILFSSIIRFRHSKGAVPATWKHNSKLEFAWTVAPVLILVGLAIPATMLTRWEYNATGSQMTVKVTGYQWLWRYNYISYEGKSVKKVPTIWSRLAWNSNRARQLDSGISPWSIVDKQTGYHDYLLNVTHPLVIPAHVKVRILITSDDVIHGFGVPDFAIKKAAIPGIMNAVWVKVEKPGIYRGQCYVLCGQDHSAMPIVVKVLPRAKFNTWLAAQEHSATLKKAARTAQAAPPKSVPDKS